MDNFKWSHLHLTADCNQACVFCSRPPKKTKDRVISKNDGKEKIKRIAKEGSGFIMFTGGEPALNSHLGFFIDYANSLGLKSAIQTNGTAFNSADLISWHKSGLRIFLVALPSHREEVCNKLRGRRTGFAELIENIKTACGLPEMEVHLEHVINSLNYKLLPDFVDFCKEMGDISINFILLNPKGWALENVWIVPKLGEVRPFLKKAAEKCLRERVRFDLSKVVPLCMVKGFEDHINLYRSQDYYVDYLKNDEVGERISLLGIKADQCKECSVIEICAGFYPEYKEIHGIEEFKPRKDSLNKLIERIRNK